MNNIEHIDSKPETMSDIIAGFKEVRADIVALRENQAETDKLLKESIAAAEKRSIEAEKRSIEAEKRGIETDKRIKKLNDALDKQSKSLDKLKEITGSHSNNLGSFAEEYFFNSFENDKRDFFGEMFDSIRKNLKGIEHDDEYDIVLINGKSVAIVEVKFKAHENDVQKVLKKAETFRINYPKYQNHKIYLGLASMAFYPELEERCKEEGIATVKQDGDTVVIYDENLKTF